ncbi:MAG: hypothetical protein ACRDGH_18145, partial [Candidatus Limnocylindria bacterium]
MWDERPTRILFHCLQLPCGASSGSEWPLCPWGGSRAKSCSMIAFQGGAPSLGHYSFQSDLAAGGHQRRRTPDANLVQAPPDRFALRLEVWLTGGPHQVSIDDLVDLRNGLRVARIFLVDRIGQMEIGKGQSIHESEQLAPGVGLSMDDLFSPIDRGCPMVEQHVRHLGGLLAVTVHLGDDEVATRFQNSEHARQD